MRSLWVWISSTPNTFDLTILTILSNQTPQSANSKASQRQIKWYFFSSASKQLAGTHGICKPTYSGAWPRCESVWTGSGRAPMSQSLPCCHCQRDYVTTTDLFSCRWLEAVLSMPSFDTVVIVQINSRAFIMWSLPDGLNTRSNVTSFEYLSARPRGACASTVGWIQAMQAPIPPTPPDRRVLI